MQTYKNINTLAKQTIQFTYNNYIYKKINHKNLGWVKFQLKETPDFTEFLKNIGFKKDIERINAKMQYYMFYQWFIDRIVYNPKSKSWQYITGQDYQTETKAIRQYLRNL